MIKKYLIFTFLFFLYVTSVFPVTTQQTEGDVSGRVTILPSLDWQKVQLEKTILSKVQNGLSKIIKSNEYVVNVELNATPAVKPKFTPPSDKDGKESKDNKNKNKIRLNDVLPDKMPKDYIVFSKLGLEVPLIDDFKDEDTEAKDGEGNPLERKKLPPFEQLWKFNNSLDIFTNLENIKIHVQLSEKLHENTRKSIKTMLDSMKFNLNDIVPSIEVTYINMEEKLLSPFPSSFKEVIALLSKFSNMIGLLLAATLLGIIAFMLFSKWEKMEKGGDGEAPAVAAAPPDSSGEDDEDKEKEVDELSSLDSSAEQDHVSSLNGVERFQTFLKFSRVEAIVLLKKWINAGEDAEKNALRSLVQQLDNELLISLFKDLTTEERERWKSFLGGKLASNDLMEANAFISNQIVEDILVPSVIVDTEICDLLLRLTPESGAKLVKDHPDSGKILMNVMNVKFVSKVIEQLDKEVIDTTLDNSMQFKNDDVESQLDTFKEKLSEYQVSEDKAPFLEKLISLIPESAPQVENSLFASLAKNSPDAEQIKEIAQTYFPALLIPVLPLNILKNILQTYPMDQKIELISSIDEEMREKFVDIFAPKGSKASDVLDLEMEKIDTDIVAQKKIREKPEEIWKEFVLYSRKLLKNEKEGAGDLEKMITQWSESIMSGKSPEEAVSSINLDEDDPATETAA